jgi:hypothetical protein
MAALLRHPWPGNVRELENVVERAVMLTADEQVRPEAFLLDASPAPAPVGLLAKASHRLTLPEPTSEYMALFLREVGGAKVKAAEILGISKRTLYRWEEQLAERDTLSQGEKNRASSFFSIGSRTLGPSPHHPPMSEFHRKSSRRSVVPALENPETSRPICVSTGSPDFGHSACWCLRRTCGEDLPCGRPCGAARGAGSSLPEGIGEVGRSCPIVVMHHPERRSTVWACWPSRASRPW